MCATVLPSDTANKPLDGNVKVTMFMLKQGVAGMIMSIYDSTWLSPSRGTVSQNFDEDESFPKQTAGDYCSCALGASIRVLFGRRNWGEFKVLFPLLADHVTADV